MISKILKGMMFTVIAATSIAQAGDSIYWKQKTAEVTVTSQGTSNNIFSDIFEKIHSITTTKDCSYTTEPEFKIIPNAGNCIDYKCTGGAGKSPQWDAFYSAKKEDKAEALADAIKGVGAKTAEALITGGYFNSKPRTWDAFKTQIKKAAADKAITQSIATLVLSTYRSDNISVLGYASGACTELAYVCDDVILLRPSQRITKSCSHTDEYVIETKAVNYTFNVNNAVLLPFETEKLSLSVSGSASELELKPSYYNSYQFNVVSDSGNQVVVDVNGIGRKQVNLPESALQSVNLSNLDSKTANLQINLGPSAAIPESSTETVVAEYNVKQCSAGFLGCKPFGWDDEHTYTVTLNSASTLIPVPVTIKPGSKGIKMEIDVKLYKQNSIYHNAKPIEKTTQKISIK